MRPQLKRLLWLGLTALWVVEGIDAAPLPKEAAPLRSAYDTGLKTLEAELKAQLGGLSGPYGQSLLELRDTLQAAGSLRPLVSVQDELLRFRKDPQPGSLALDCVELTALQQEYAARVAQVRYSNEVEVVHLAGRYLQALLELRASLMESNKAELVAALDEERDRTLASTTLRDALQRTRTMPPPLPSYAEAAPAPTNSVVSKARSLKLYRLQGEDVAAVMGYSVELSLLEDESKVRVRESVAGQNRSRSEEGPVLYVPRVTIHARNAEVPADAQLVIEYYSRSLTESGFRKESVETLPLAAIVRGDSATVEGRGLSLTRSISVAQGARGPGSSTYGGSELYGVVLTLRDANREALMVRFTPQSLSKVLEAP